MCCELTDGGPYCKPGCNPDAVLPWEAPFTDALRRTPTSWLPARDASDLIIPLPDGGYQVEF